MLRTAAILGLLAAIGPFAVDMYLPAIPVIGEDLGASIPATQMTLTVYFLAFGIAQLFYGPYSDQVGRKKPLYLGLVVFVVGSIGCALAPSIGWLLLFRFIQGIGGASVMVVPRAVIRDMFTGTQATRLMAMVMLVISISPMLAPLSGSGLILIADWRAIFWVLFIAGAASLLITGFLQPETLAKEARIPVNIRTLMRGCRVLLTDRMFMGLTFIGGFGMASFFVFIASASFVYTGEFGLTPTEFSLAFAVNAIGFFAASQFAAPLGERFGLTRVVASAVIGFAFFSVLLVILTLFGMGTLPMTITFLFLANACLGLVIPATMVMALDHHGDIAGLASSLGGTLQMVAGGVMITAVGPFFDGTTLPMVTAIALCAAIALLLASRVLPGPKPVRHRA
ncbi:MAG: Bcr/CflA family efflux MFS transporter [Alphaproteobacteria bacterium]|nr:MAG: Bcr/CflA family efflux MFS transporter [Alphaproteobacteria bacterium]